jgi:hypothetical protein
MKPSIEGWVQAAVQFIVLGVAGVKNVGKQLDQTICSSCINLRFKQFNY